MHLEENYDGEGQRAAEVTVCYGGGIGRVVIVPERSEWGTVRAG